MSTARRPRRGKVTETIPSPGQCESKIRKTHQQKKKRAFYAACKGMSARDWPVAMKCFNYRNVQVLSESMYRESAESFGADLSRKTPPTPPQCIYT